MRSSRLSIRYAKALLQLSVEKESLEKSYEDMLIFRNTCYSSKELRLLLKNPIIKTDKKIVILKQIFDSKISKMSMMFIDIIVRKKRESHLTDIAESFIMQYKIANNIVEASVTTANPLSVELRNQVIGYIKNYSEKTVELTEEVDESIIGGTIIKIGDKQLDSSISSEVSELRQMFNKNLYIQDF
tara:strand:+ start:1094 stop:1651 length:558 start_codon:yes stop_codon:yes gene_type:complete